MDPASRFFYGNSEVSKNGDLHGWVEGALEMVEEALPRITELLGLDPPFQAQLEEGVVDSPNTKEEERQNLGAAMATD